MQTSGGASTFAKGLSVLNCFEGGRSDLTMADIARLTGFDRATARRLCLTLEESGYLRREGRTFELTPKVVALGGGYLASRGIGRFVQPTLNQFSDAMKGEISLAVREGKRALYLARSDGASTRLSMGFSVGSALPLLPTSVGRMLLACCETQERDALIETAPLVRHTEATNLDRESIRQEVIKAAGQGYAYCTAEFERGAAGVAVPVPKVGDCEAVLATSASVNQFSRPGELDRVLDMLRTAAARLRE